MVPDPDEPIQRDEEIAELVGELRSTGNMKPLIALLRGSDGGPEHARDALRLLGELDVDILVQLALDTLIEDYLDAPERARQTRRIVHGLPSEGCETTSGG
jgi:hypothetical protein